MKKRNVLNWLMVLCVLIAGLSFAVAAQESTEPAETTETTQATVAETTQPETTETTQQTEAPETTEPTQDTMPGGSCGENVKWRFDEDTGTLTIYGTGETDNYSSRLKPWEMYKQDIKKLVVESGRQGTVPRPEH